MSRIDDVDVLESPLRSMLFDVVHAVCSEFMTEVLCACVSAPHADVKTLPGIIQCAVTTVQQWTPVQRDAQARRAIHIQPGLPQVLTSVLEEYRLQLEKAGFNTNSAEGNLGTFIHNTLLGVVSDDHGLVLRLEYFRQTADAWTARWLLHRHCMRKALIMELAPAPPAPQPAKRDEPIVDPEDSVSNVDATSDEGRQHDRSAHTKRRALRQRRRRRLSLPRADQLVSPSRSAPVGEASTPRSPPASGAEVAEAPLVRSVSLQGGGAAALGSPGVL